MSWKLSDVPASAHTERTASTPWAVRPPGASVRLIIRIFRKAAEQMDATELEKRQAYRDALLEAVYDVTKGSFAHGADLRAVGKRLGIPDAEVNSAWLYLIKQGFLQPKGGGMRASMTVDAVEYMDRLITNRAQGRPTVADRNRNARKVLAYLYAEYERVQRVELVSLSETFDGTKLDSENHTAAIERLANKQLLKEEGLMVQMTPLGINASENPALLNQILPTDQPPPKLENNTMSSETPDPKKVFIIHGRNLRAKKAVEQFLRSLGLTPIDFEQLAADLGAAFIGEIVRTGLSQAQGIVALFTADEIAHLRPDHYEPHDGQEDKERWQARPNVIFEAGMAYGMAPERTILAVLGGQTKLFSDVKGIHLTYLSNNHGARKRLRQKLIGAKCDVDLRVDAWDDPEVSGNFDSCVLPEVSTRHPFRD